MTFGVIKGIVAFIQYFICTNFFEEDNYHECNKFGPGAGTFFIVEVISFVGQVILMWLAYFILCFSKQKGTV